MRNDLEIFITELCTSMLLQIETSIIMSGYMPDILKDYLEMQDCLPLYISGPDLCICGIFKFSYVFYTFAAPLLTQIVLSCHGIDSLSVSKSSPLPFLFTYSLDVG